MNIYEVTALILLAAAIMLIPIANRYRNRGEHRSADNLNSAGLALSVTSVILAVIGLTR